MTDVKTSHIADETAVQELSMIALDLVDAEAALAVAKLLADQTGRTVTVRDADGEVLGTFRGATKN